MKPKRPKAHPVLFTEEDGHRLRAVVLAYESQGLVPSFEASRSPVFKPQGFAAKITDVDYSTGRYSFQRLEANSGTFSVNAAYTSGLKGDSTGYAVELTGNKFYPYNTATSYVWLYPSGDNFYWFLWQNPEVWGKHTVGISKGGSGTITIYKHDRTTTSQTVTATFVSTAYAANKWARIWWEGSSILGVQVEC